MPRRRFASSTPGDGTPVIAGYSNLTIIGRGATATVYRAAQDGFDRQVAVKVINVDVSDRRAQRRFQRERALNGRLSDHPNVVTVLDSGFVNDRYPYLVTELFDQGSLADRLTQHGPLDLAAALHIGVRIAGALESAHRLGVLHRDVKPHNILLSRFGEPALADFGIAALLEMERSLTAALTPVHAAPEVLEGGDAGPTADVYSLASTLYTLLAGTPPFAGPPGEGMLSQMLRITTAEVPPMPRSDVPGLVTDALRVALAKQPVDRPATAAAFGALLQQVQADVGLAPTPLPVDAPNVTSGFRPPASPSTLADPPGMAQPARPAPSADDTIDVDRSAVAASPVVSGPVTAGAAMPSTALAAVPPSVLPAAVPPAAVPPAGAPLPVAADDGHTVIARQKPPPVVPDGRPGRRWLVPVVGVGALAVGIGATLFVINITGDDDAAESTVPDSVVFNDPASFRPGDVTVSEVDGALFLQWTDRTAGQRPHVIYVFDGDGSEPRSWNVPLGESSQIADGQDPTAPACFIVRAIIEIGPPVVSTDAEPACINGAVFES